MWFPGAEKHVEDERIDQAAYREAVQNLHDSGNPCCCFSGRLHAATLLVHCLLAGG